MIFTAEETGNEYEHTLPYAFYQIVEGTATFGTRGGTPFVIKRFLPESNEWAVADTAYSHSAAICAIELHILDMRKTLRRNNNE